MGEKKEIYVLMNELAKKGMAIIMISSEMQELLGMSDRIIVMHEGEMMGELKKEDATQEKILELRLRNQIRREDMKQILKKFSTLIILVVLVVIFSVASPNFLRVNNLLNVLRQVAVIGILTAGMTYVIISGGMDLTVGAYLRSFRCCSCTVDQCRRSGTGSGDSDNSADDCDWYRNRELLL